MWCNGNTPDLGSGVAVQIRHFLPLKTRTAKILRYNA